MAKLVSYKSLLDEELKTPEFAVEFSQMRAALEFAFSLTLLREERGLTQAALGERAGIKQPMIARIEKGQIPNTTTLQKLACALNAQVHILPDGCIKIEALDALPKAA